MNTLNVILLVAIHSASCWAMEQQVPTIEVTYYDSDNEQQERKSEDDRERLCARLASRRKSIEQLATARDLCKCAAQNGIAHEWHSIEKSNANG